MVRYKPSQFTKKELEAMVGVLALDKGLDMITGGRINQLSKRAAVQVYRFIVKPAARIGTTSLGRLAVTGAQVVKQVALKHPVLTAGAVVYYTYKHKDEIADLVEQGYEVTKPVVEAVKERVDPVIQLTAPGRQELFETMQPRPAPFIPAIIEQFRPKRKSSVFNKAVKAGMLAVKKSPSYGGKGKIKPATKVFGIVTKLASAKKKKKKAPKKGIRRRIWNAMGRYL